MPPTMSDLVAVPLGHRELLRALPCLIVREELLLIPVNLGVSECWFLLPVCSETFHEAQ
jgi:hypothetical protein